MKKYRLLFLTLLLSIFCLTGCSNEDIKLNLQSFNLNFRYFLLPNTESSQSLKLNAIDLNKDKFTIVQIEEMDKILEDVYKKCSNVEFYEKNKKDLDAFYEPIKQYCNNKSIETIIVLNDFKTSIDNIFERDKTEFYTTNIIALHNVTNERYYEVEVICLTDSDSFLIEYLYVYVDDENKITNIKLLDELEFYKNSTKELDKSSLLNEFNIHSDFINAFTKLKHLLTNANLYQKYNLASKDVYLTTDVEHNLTQEEIDSIEYLEEMKQQVDSLITSVNTVYDFETLKQFYLTGEGTFKNTFITSYKIDDFNGLATSTYTIKSVSDGKLYEFEFTFDRVENKITKILMKN